MPLTISNTYSFFFPWWYFHFLLSSEFVIGTIIQEENFLSQKISKISKYISQEYGLVKREYISCDRKYSSYDTRCSLFFLWQELYFLSKKYFSFDINHTSDHKKCFFWNEVYAPDSILPQESFVRQKSFLMKLFVVLGVSHFCNKIVRFPLDIFDTFPQLRKGLSSKYKSII